MENKETPVTPEEPEEHRPLTDEEVEALTADLSEEEIQELADAHNEAQRDPNAPKEKKVVGTYWSMGLAIGLCLGSLIGKVFFDALGTGMTWGAVVGLGIGTCINRKA